MTVASAMGRSLRCAAVPDRPPLVLLHGFLDTPRTWDLVRPALERRHEVLAPALAGHLGGPPLAGPLGRDTLAEAVERAMDDAGLRTAHVAGNSLGGHVALQLAARGRARSVVALAPAGGWRDGDPDREATLRLQGEVQAAMRAAAPHADAIVATPEGRRRATSSITVRFEHIPPELLAHMIRGGAAVTAAAEMLAHARTADWSIDAERIACPVRIVWGTEDRLLPWPSTAARYREDWLPHADWVVLEDVGHAPQLDVPLEAAQLILGVTAQ
jgi:pimeloyl-ACP methyl ester carboxylesterase